MINIKQAKRYCNEDISLIENYCEAMASTEKWECHHRIEEELNVSVKELKEMGVYYNRPATELIFLSSADHRSFHGKNRTISQEVRDKIANTLKGRPSGMLGKNHTEETIERIRQSNLGQKRRAETCNKISQSKKGKKINSTRAGKKMYINKDGIKKLFTPGQEPEGWVWSGRKIKYYID